MIRDISLTNLRPCAAELLKVKFVSAWMAEQLQPADVHTKRNAQKLTNAHYAGLCAQASHGAPDLEGKSGLAIRNPG